MRILTRELQNNKEWRINELQQLKSLVYSEYLENNNNYSILSKYAIPTSCAIWEGFLKESIGDYFSFYNRHSNSENDITMLTKIVEHNKLVTKTFQDFETKRRLVSDMKNLFENPKFNEYKPEIGLKKLKDTNKLLNRIKLDPLDKNYEIKLNSMINIRNTIIHGEKTNLQLSPEEIENYITITKDLIEDLEQNILNKSKELANN